MSGASIIDGKKLALEKLQQVKSKVDALIESGSPAPCLATILIGNDPASEIYIHHKHNACKKTGIISKAYQLESNTQEQALLSLIDELNQDPAVHGILVQLPLPEHINTSSIIESIAPEKDVDGFHPYNLGRLAQRQPKLRPCTPLGIMQLLEQTGVKFIGQHAVIVGASNIVGRPMSLELLLAGATVTICHRHTKDLAYHVKQADILVAAVGKPGLIKGDWIKPGAIVIDVGINRLADGTLTGDVEFEKAKQKASFITPVPGGVGPMTVATLMQNTLNAALLS